MKNPPTFSYFLPKNPTFSSSPTGGRPECVIEDHTGHELIVVSGETNITYLDGLREMVGKTKVEITNIGWIPDNIKATEKSQIVFDDEV